MKENWECNSDHGVHNNVKNSEIQEYNRSSTGNKSKGALIVLESVYE